MGRPSVLSIQYYRPLLPDLHEWVETDIDGLTGVQAANDFEFTDAIRLKLGGDNFHWKLPPGKTEPWGGYAVYSGDDEYCIWDDEKFLYVVSLNPDTEEDDRRVVLESWGLQEGHSDLGRPTRVFMRKSLMDILVPAEALRFVGVQVPDDHARELGLII